MSKILMVREVGDPVLYQRSKEVDVKALTQEDLADIASMKEPLLYTGGYGIAAVSEALRYKQPLFPFLTISYKQDQPFAKGRSSRMHLCHIQHSEVLSCCFHSKAGY